MLTQNSDRDGLDKELLFWDRKNLTTFPSDCQLTFCNSGTPALSAANKFTPSLASTASHAPSKRKSEATLSSPGRTEFFWIWVVGYLILFFFPLLLSLVSHLYLVYKQLLSGQKAIHKSFTKKGKGKQGAHIFCCLFGFFSLEPALADEVWQAGRQAAPLPSFAAGWWLAGWLQGSYTDICQLRTWTRPSEPMPALPVSTTSGCVWVLRSQPETFLFRLIHFITFMTVKIYSLSALVLKGGVQNLWITRSVLPQEGHSVCFAM